MEENGADRGRVSSLYSFHVHEGQPPPQALRFSKSHIMALGFSQGRGERLVMNHKGQWEGYRRQAK